MIEYAILQMISFLEPFCAQAQINMFDSFGVTVGCIVDKILSDR